MAPPGNGDGGGAQQPSCTTVPLGKSVRRALRAAIGMQKRKPKDKPKNNNNKKKPKPPPCGSGGRDDGVPVSSMELSSSSSVAARKEEVVRVVMKGGVVEVYPGVVLACTVIRNHPPGLCLAHPDVFRNPHGAVVRPLEPLFPGQKFLLIPLSTVIKLKNKIPESSIGAFADEEYYNEDAEEEEEVIKSSESEGYSGGAVSSSEEEAASTTADDDDDDGTSTMPACSARDYFVAKDRWSESRFKQLVAQGLAVGPSKDDDDEEEPAERKKKKKQQQQQEKEKSRNKKGKKRKGRRRRNRSNNPVVPLPLGLRVGFSTARRTWEPSLPSVEEEEVTVDDVSPRQPPPSTPQRTHARSP